MLKSDLNGGRCDGCGKDMSLMDFYNQDGVCVACFEKWMDEVSNCDDCNTEITGTTYYHTGGLCMKCLDN